MRKAKMGICTYCGRFRELTRDHVIVTCLFIPPLPGNMITVPACKECNERKKSRDDSLLRDFLCMDAWGNNHPTAQELFAGKAMRSIDHRTSELGPMVAANARLKPLYSLHGVYLGEAVQYEIPERRIERIIITIVRGLYFDARKRKQRLPDNCQFHVARHFPWQFKMIQESMARLHTHGPRFLADVFGCDYAIATEDPYSTLWVVWFYNRVVFSVSTDVPKSLTSSSLF